MPIVPIRILSFALILLMALPAMSQVLRDESNREVRSNPNKELEEREEAAAKAKRGIRTWTTDSYSGLTDSVATDTLHHMFQNSCYSDGARGLYSNLGNLGSPRLSKVFALRPEMTDYIFTQPYDFFIQSFDGFHFTNTFSPITNLTYHSSGDSDNGEDHFMSKFATNISKDAGVGFNIDYLYGRGYHDNQATGHFGFNFYGSVLKPRYKAHWLVYANYLKNQENGGITDDSYVTDPQQFPTSFTTREIPTNLDKVWNKMHINGGQLTHRYSFGYEKKIERPGTADSLGVDSTRRPAPSPGPETPGRPEQKPVQPEEKPQVPEGALSAREVDRQIALYDPDEPGLPTMEKPDSTVFVPVTSIIHTLKVGVNYRQFLANESLEDYYTYKYLANDSVDENTDNVMVSNYLALELSEGLNKYLSAGIRLFGMHEFNSYKMPGLDGRESFTTNRVTLGGQIFREQSQRLNYLLHAQTSSDGDSWGEYELRANAQLTTPLFGDSVLVSLRASSVNRKPTFFYQHYQSTYLWWDNENLDQQMTNHLGATLESKRLALRLKADYYNISNYTYFATALTEHTTTADADTTTTPYTTNTTVAQSS